MVSEVLEPTKLFSQMGKLVKDHVEAYQSDFNIDREKIVRLHDDYGETLFYWYLRECGTHLISAEELKWIETHEGESATFWLPQAKMIFEVNTDTQTLKAITPSKMLSIIKKAKPMSEEMKLDYLIKWMANPKFNDMGGTSNILCQMARFYRFKHPVVDRMVEEYPGIYAIRTGLRNLKENLYPIKA